LRIRVVAVVAASGAAAADIASVTADKINVKFRGHAKNKRTSNENEI
jgi:hypothetical protein